MAKFPSNQVPNIVIQHVDNVTNAVEVQAFPSTEVFIPRMDPEVLPSGSDCESESTGLSNLLHEELAKIFFYLNVEERQLLRPVCSQWKEVIDMAFGMKVRIKNSTSDLITSSHWAVDVELNSMTIPFQTGISFAQNVRKFTFSNIVVTYNLVSFLRACSNINYLGFINIVLDQPINDPWGTLIQENELIPLHRVEILEVKSFSFADGVIEIFSFLTEKVSFLRLKEVRINVQNPAVLPLQVLLVTNYTPTHPLLRLLKNNLHTLTYFSLGRTAMPTVMKFFENSSSDNNSRLPRQLEHLEIHPYFREEWSPLLRNQFRIRLMHLGSCNVSRWREIEQAIAANCRTLESFSIGGLSFGQVWNCAAFQNCLVLRDLFIEISHSHKAHLNQLPRQLKSLHIFGPVAKAEIASIAETLFELESLRFTHLGRIAEFNGAEDDKITLDIFKALLQLPKMNVIIFTACSSISIDWDLISNWCASTRQGTKGFVYFERFHQVHGQYFRNGITVELTEEFDRDGFDWNKEPIPNLYGTVPDNFAGNQIPPLMAPEVEANAPPAEQEDNQNIVSNEGGGN